MSIPPACRLTTSPWVRWSRRCAKATTTWADGWWNSPGASIWCAAAARKSTADLENVVLANSPSGVPVTVRDIGNVTLGPDLRRGVSDLDGRGEVVSGIIVMRQGENALRVIDRVKAKIKEIEPGLPPGVKLVTAYDRSELILASIDNLKRTLIEELAVVALIILIFLWHVPSAAIPIITIPVAVMISFIPMRMMGMTANIMSLGGNRDRHRRHGGRGHRGGGADAQEARRMAAHGPQRGLPYGSRERGEGSRRPQFLRAAGDCGFVPAGADAGSAGRAAFQTAGLHEEFRHDRGGAAGHHARSGHAADVHPHGELPVPAALARAPPMPCWWEPFTRRTNIPSAAC